MFLSTTYLVSIYYLCTGTYMGVQRHSRQAGVTECDRLMAEFEIFGKCENLQTKQHLDIFKGNL